MDLERFAAVLADRFSEIVPAGFHVAAADGMLWYRTDEGRFPGQLGNYRVGQSGSHIRSNFGVYGESDEENIVGVAVHALDELQDYVSEASHVPWPDVTSQPKPHGKIIDAHLDLWYGDPDDRALSCSRIPLAQLE